ncbi:hypothetical protein M5D96_006791 [Drosophila gunungcola]|uniref:Uncharacterized protein n=2 Tax=Drosophila gunungcola TaxID=103775 RepID=A0A9P9YPN3_9MUSC|nr:hypothetical protein M5D96_006791 [Drosophila gunungcola]
MEMVYSITNFKSKSNVFILCLNILACLIVLVFLTVGIFGVLMERIKIIRMLMFSLVAFCLIRVVIWIVCGNLEDILTKTITHLWFQLNTALSITCTVMTVMFCMRLHMLSQQLQLDQ